ncbi:SGNH/GDSL hydrolase family protein [Kitasatospora indigofera]|uniref:SGNH/GDSL hydrolase family protein n=1 Tax=Kitasatospora indigofera TaxID=67307 RepID=UPI0036816A40
MTDPREAATLLAIGADTNGYAESSGVPWDDDLGTYNLRALEQRNALLALDARANLAALRRVIEPPTASIPILCGGDSITVGESSADGTGYRGWLTDLLARRRITANLTTVAQGGRTMREMAPVILAALPTAKPSVVLLAFGTNDVAQPDMTDWQARCGQLVDQILSSSPTVRVALARIAYSRAAWLANGEAAIDTAVDAVVAARKASGRVVAADMTVVPQRWTNEGVHPLDAGYLMMAQQWLDAINPWLPTT